MLENTCIRCGRIIPDGEYQCVACSEYDEMQTFSGLQRQRRKKPMKYFIITDECGWTYYVATDNMKLNGKTVLLTPHVRSAREITYAEFEKGGIR